MSSIIFGFWDNDLKQWLRDANDQILKFEGYRRALIAKTGYGPNVEIKPFLPE